MSLYMQQCTAYTMYIHISSSLTLPQSLDRARQVQTFHSECLPVPPPPPPPPVAAGRPPPPPARRLPSRQGGRGGHPRGDPGHRCR